MYKTNNDTKRIPNNEQEIKRWMRAIESGTTIHRS